MRLKDKEITDVKNSGHTDSIRYSWLGAMGGRRGTKMFLILTLITAIPCGLQAAKHMTNSDSYVALDYTTSDETFFFEVMGPGDAHIGLSNGVIAGGGYGEEMYEFVIGTHTVFRRVAKYENTVSKYTPGIINGSEYRKFWISWKDHQIRLGKGWQVNQKEIISYDASQTLYLVNTISISSYHRIVVHWISVGVSVIQPSTMPCVPVMNLSNFDIDSVINDEDNNTCITVTPTPMGESVFFIIRGMSPEIIKINVVGMPSCDEPFLTVLSHQKMVQLPLVSATKTSNGGLLCNFAMLPIGDCSTVIMIIFQRYRAQYDSLIWQLCDVTYA